LAETAITFNVPRGTALITVQQVITYATALLYYVLLVRILNLSQIGEISLLTAAFVIFTTVSQIALPLAATRFISASAGTQKPSEAAGVARASLRLLVAVSSPMLVLAVLASPQIGIMIFKTSDPTPLIAAFAGAFLVDIITLYGGYFLGLGRYADLAYQNILYFPLSRGFGLVLAAIGFGILGIPLGWTIAGFATIILSLYLWRGKLPKPENFSSRRLLAFSLPLFASTVIVSLQNWGDVALIQGVVGAFSTTGAYYLIISSVSFLSILWMPVSGALYPALSSSFNSQGPAAVARKLGVAARLVNLTVLPAGFSLAAISGTALVAVYGPSLANQAVPFAILAMTIIFTAQSLLLTTTLQSVGRTPQILAISAAATLVDLLVVYLGAATLGTTAGALGRVLLAIFTLFLAWLALNPVLHPPVTRGLTGGILLSAVTAFPLLVFDYVLTVSLNVRAVYQIPPLFVVFVTFYTVGSRVFSVFKHEDFVHLKLALPGFFRSVLVFIEQILVAG